MDKKKKQAIIQSIAAAIENEQDAYNFIEMLSKEDWGKWIETTCSKVRYKELPCVLCKTMYFCGDGPCTGLCSPCLYTNKGTNIISNLSMQRSRARDLGLPYSLTLREWYATLEHFNYLCAYCENASHKEMEHFIPLVLGGGTAKSNCVPACGACNRKKRNYHPLEVADRFPKGAIDRISLYLSQF